MQIIRRLSGMFSAGPTCSEMHEPRVSRLKGPDGASSLWERRILELCDNRPLRDIIQLMYVEELQNGAWVADIGLWKSLFD
jgi:hypothetical protein